MSHSQRQLIRLNSIKIDIASFITMLALTVFFYYRYIQFPNFPFGYWLFFYSLIFALLSVLFSITDIVTYRKEMHRTEHILTEEEYEALLPPVYLEPAGE